MVIDLPRDVKDVLVADPKIANAVVRSSQRAYIIGAAVGQTNVVFFDADGQQVAAYDIAVKRDLNGVRAALRQTLPGHPDRRRRRRRDADRLGIELRSRPSRPARLAARLVGGADKVVNSIAVRGRDQVMLKVTVAEVRRDIVKQMGVDLSASMNYGTAVGRTSTIAIRSPPTVAPLVAGNGLTGSASTKAGLPSVTATLRAMESAGVVRTLAEPNLTAISGESATFISGGEFPIPAGVILPNDDVRRHRTMRPDGQLQEIRHLAQLHAGGADRGTDQPAGDDRSVGSLDRKRFDWAVPAERRSPRSRPAARKPRWKSRPAAPMAMAGLIQEQTKQAINGLPGVGPDADSWAALQEPGLRQQPDRTDGHGDALCRSRGRAEGTVASR